MSDRTSPQRRSSHVLRTALLSIVGVALVFAGATAWALAHGLRINVVSPRLYFAFDERAFASRLWYWSKQNLLEPQTQPIYQLIRQQHIVLDRTGVFWGPIPSTRRVGLMRQPSVS